MGSLQLKLQRVLPLSDLRNEPAFEPLLLSYLRNVNYLIYDYLLHLLSFFLQTYYTNFLFFSTLKTFAAAKVLKKNDVCKFRVIFFELCKFLVYFSIFSCVTRKKEPVNSDSFRLLIPPSRSSGTACRARRSSVGRANDDTSP